MRRLFPVFAVLIPIAILWVAIGPTTRFFVAIPGRPALTTNPRFGWTFFPPSLARTPLPCYLRDPKPPNTYRIFILGSSAALGIPDPAFSFGRQLEVMLREAWPDRRVEVINAAMTAINSHVLVPIAGECARFQPDLFLVYAGNNEVVGPYGPGTVFAGFSSSLPLIRASIWARSTRLGQLLRPHTPQEWGGMEMFLRNQVYANDPRLEAVSSHFRRNLKDLRTGPRVLYATVAVNLRDQPPFASPAAMEAYRQGRWAEARDLDPLRFRADSRINQIIREVAGPDLVDAEPVLDGRENFYEHVHLTFDGNYRLASLFFRRLAGGEPVPAARVAAELAYTPWNEYQMALYMYRLMSRAPFTAPAELRAPPPTPEDLLRSRQAYQAAIERSPDDLLLRQNYARLDPAAAEPQWRALLERIPNHPLWRTELAGVLTEQGRLEAAATELEGVLRADPAFAPAHFALGVVQEKRNNPATAAIFYQEALRLDPFLAKAHNNLGRLLMGREAALHFRRAVDLEPDFPEARYNLAGALLQMRRTDSAVQELRAALRFQPDFPEAHFTLGTLLPSIPHLREAVRLKPDFPDAHYNLGLLLARQNQYAEAATHYEEAIRLRPDYAEAHNNLGKILAVQGKAGQAIAHFQKALELKPSLGEARQNLDQALRSGNR